MLAKRRWTVSIVKWSPAGMESSSSHVMGVETGAPGRARVE
jgi:hypothetical protein